MDESALDASTLARFEAHMAAHPDMELDPLPAFRPPADDSDEDPDSFH